MSFALVAKRASLAPGAWVRNDLWRRARAVPSLDLRFADDKSLADATTGQNLVTFTRASSGTYVGSDGLIKTATTNGPRFDHNPTTGESLGLLVEEQRTNICVQSEDFSQNQAINNVSVATNQITAPDGTTTADLVTSTLAATPNTCWVQQLSAVTASTATYVISCFVKQGTSPSVSLNIAMTGGTYVEAFANFNFSTKAIGLGGGGAASATAGYQQLANGWFRFWLTLPNNNTGTGVSHRVYVRSEASANAVGDSVYLWGRVTEVGAFPTSYIPTTSATVTRSADVASISGSNYSGWRNASAGTVYSDSQVIKPEIQTQVVYHFGGLTYDISLRQPQGTANQFRANIGSVFTSAPGTGGTLSDGTTKATVAYSGTAGRLQVGSSSDSVTMAGALDATQLFIGSLNSATQLNGTIKRFTYWPQRLSNNVLQEITR